MAKWSGPDQAPLFARPALGSAGLAGRQVPGNPPPVTLPDDVSVLQRLLGRLVWLWWPVLLPLIMSVVSGLLVADTVQATRTLTDTRRSAAAQATVVSSESAGKGGWSTVVRFTDTAGAQHTEHLVVGDSRFSAGRVVTVRYAVADPTLVAAEPVRRLLGDDLAEGVMFAVFFGSWLLGGLAYLSLSTPGAFLDRRVTAWNRRHGRPPAGERMV